MLIVALVALWYSVPPDEMANEADGLTTFVSPISSASTAELMGVAGISVSSRVTVSVPPVSPRSCSDRPGPCPGCIGARP